LLKLAGNAKKKKEKNSENRITFFVGFFSMVKNNKDICD
jgi:hypothetical protein